MTDLDNLITSAAVKDLTALSAFAEMFFGDGSPTVEQQLKEEIRLMDEFHNRCFD